MLARLWLTALLLVAPGAVSAAESPYLFVWAGDADGKDSDFVAVVDARRSSPGHGRVLTTLAVGRATGAHHSEHWMSEGGRLLVNGFPTGISFILDLEDPEHPSLAATVEVGDELQYPHSFERLADGNVLATFQNGPGGPGTTGGLGVLDGAGRLVRWASAAVAEKPTIRPYSLAVVPGIDRVVSTTTDMRGRERNDTVQVWSLADLKLQATVLLPRGPRGDENLHPAEPRLLNDGSTVLVSTFGCGLYRMDGLQTASPRARHIYSFRSTRSDGNEAPSARFCALPAVVGDFWVQTVPARDGVVAVDITDTGRIREVGSVSLGPDRFPHWMAGEPDGDRLVVTGFGELSGRVTMLHIDRETGRLAIDGSFGTDGTIDFDRESWPHGDGGPSLPHGVVFSEARR